MFWNSASTRGIRWLPARAVLSLWLGVAAAYGQGSSNTVIVDFSPIVAIDGAGTRDSGERIRLFAGPAHRWHQSYQWRKDGADIPGATNRAYEIETAAPEHSGTYQVMVVYEGSPRSASAELTVRPPAPPVVTSQTSSQVVPAAKDVTFTVYCTGTHPLAYQWYRNGVAIENATEPKLELKRIHPDVAGAYTLKISNALGSVESVPAQLTVSPAPLPPIGARDPRDYKTEPGGHAEFRIYGGGQIGGDYPETYQWYKDGVPIPGETTTILRLRGARFVDAGRYSVKATNFIGSTMSREATLAVEPHSTHIGKTSRLANLAIRAVVDGGDQALIPGFVIGGSASKRVLIRAAGPALAAFGVSNTLRDPAIAVLDASGTVMGANDNWSGASNSADILAAAARVGGFTFAPASRDAAVLLDLAPGSYTVRTSGNDGGSGVTLVEVYDANPGASARLINISARAQVGPDADALIPGIVIQGEAPRTLLIRAVGPGLAPFGVSGTLSDPKLEIYQGTQHMVTIDDWGYFGYSWHVAAVTAGVGAFALPPGSRDAAVVLGFSPGSYTAKVVSADGSSGAVLVEVYEISN